MAIDVDNLQSMLFNVARDDLSLKSFGDYLEKQGNIGYALLDEMTTALDGEQVIDDVTKGTMVITDNNNQMHSIDTQKVLDACYNGDDYITVDGVSITLESIIMEQGNASSGLTAMSEVLKQNYQDTVINGKAGTNVSDIISRLQSKFTNLTESAANVAYNTIDIIGNISISAKERVVLLMNYLKGNVDEWDGIGSPSSDFSQAADGSAALIFSLNAVKGASSISDYVKRSFQTAFEVVGSFFSNIWDSIAGKVTEQYDLIIGNKDSFRVDTSIKANHFNKFCVNFKIDNSDIYLDDAWIHYMDYSYGEGYRNIRYEDDILTKLNLFCNVVSSGTGTSTDIQAAAYQLYRDLGGSMDIYDRDISYIMKMCYYSALSNRGLNYNVDQYVSSFENISDICEKILEVYRANYLLNYVSYFMIDHLDFDRYVHTNLPAGELYLWRDKARNILYGQIYTVPLHIDWSDFITAFNENSFNESVELIEFMSNCYEKFSILDNINNFNDSDILKFIGHSMFLNFMYMWMLNNWFHIPSYGSPYDLLTVIANDFNSWAGLTDGTGGTPHEAIVITGDANHDLVTDISIGADYFANDTAVGYARRLCCSTTGSVIEKGYATPISDILNYLFEDEFYFAYERINQVFPGKYTLYSNEDLNIMFKRGLGVVTGAVIVIAATIFALKLKKAIYRAQGRADNKLYSAYNEETGEIDESVIDDGFKLQKKANLLSLISSFTVGAVKTMVSRIGLGIISFASTVYNGVTSRVNKQSNINNSATNVNIDNIYEVITGRRPNSNSI